MAFGFPAIAFTGIPILTPLIGDKATLVVDVAGLTGNIVILPATLVLLSYAQEQKPSGSGKACERGQQQGSVLASVTKALRNAFTQPVILAPLFAVAFVLTNIHLPSVVTGSFKLG